MWTGSIRALAGFWGVVGVAMIPSGVAIGRWWILLSAVLLIGGSSMLWWASGRHVLPEGRASADAAFQRANRWRLVAVLVMLAGAAVTVLGWRASVGS